MELRKSIGKKIKLSRELLHLTQEKFAELAKIDISYLSYVEHGKRNVSIDVLERIANALQINIEPDLLAIKTEVLQEREVYMTDIMNIMQKMDIETLKGL